MNITQSLQELYSNLEDEQDISTLTSAIEKLQYDFEAVKNDVNGEEKLKNEIPEKLYCKTKALLNYDETVTVVNNNPIKLGNCIDEYQEIIANAIQIVCEQIYKLSVPDAILKFISELCSLSINTQILTWNEIEWIYNNVIPTQYMTDRLYNVSPIINQEDKNSFQTYDSYKFHDFVDEKGPNIFIIECKMTSGSNIVIGGYCDQSWWSPHKRNLQPIPGNMGYFVDDSFNSKMFVLRNDDLTKKLTDISNISLPLLAINKTTDEKIMVVANADGPNFGYNHFFVTSSGSISTYNESKFFGSPVKDMFNINFRQFLTYRSGDLEDDSYDYWSSRPQIVGFEVFAVQPIRSEE